MKRLKLKLKFRRSKKSSNIFGSDVLSNEYTVRRRGGWVENFELPTKGDNASENSQTRISNIIPENTWFIFLALIIAITSIVGMRSFFLQVYKGETYRAIAEGNRIRQIPIIPKRGLIYDSQGEEIATNIPLFLLIVRGADLPLDKKERDQILLSMQELGAQASLQKIEDELARKPEAIAAELTYEQALTFIPAVQDMPGVEVVMYERRNYIDPEIYSHIIGYLAPITEDEVDTLTDNYLINDYIGKIGIEHVYENELRGELGIRGVEVDSRGKEIKVTSVSDPNHGLNLHLTIDVALQKKAYELVDEFLEDKEHKRASFIAVNPKNGEVLALVSYPGYNNQAFYQGIDTEEYQSILENPDRPLFNRSISGQYPPGSTFKTILATAGLEQGLITPNTTFLSTGGIQVSRWFFPDWKAGGHGYTNIYKAISESVNTYFYILGGGYKEFAGLGSEKIRQKAIEYGLLSKTDIDLTAEAEGFYPTPQWKREVKDEPWYIGDTYNLSIGQGDVLVTPIQMAMLTSSIANGGVLYKPHLIHHFSTREDDLIYRDNDWVNKESVGNTYAVDVVKRAMRQTVTGSSGSARSMQIVPSSVSGKTGTAQWSSTEEPHGWFIGFAPYDEPEIALVVLVESSGGGSTASVPIARNFLTWYFTDYKENL